jgi:hypothetical protein
MSQPTGKMQPFPVWRRCILHRISSMIARSTYEYSAKGACGASLSGLNMVPMIFLCANSAEFGEGTPFSLEASVTNIVA